MLYKKIIYFLFLSLLIPQISLAQEGKVILDIKEDKELEMIDYIGLYKEYMQELDYFDKKYPRDQINKDFEDDLAEIHPDYSDSWINKKQTLLRIGVKSKRIYEYLKEQVKEILLENDVPLEYDDDEYEFGEKEEYQESSEPLIIVDIKKVIAYSKSPKDQKAIKEKRAKDLGLQTSYDRRQEMKKALLNRDWKKLFSHGLFDGKVLDDERGIGQWVKADNVKAKIVSIKKYITDKNKISGIIRFEVPEDVIILRRDFQGKKGIEIDFSKSDNVDDVKINWPIPQRVFFSHNDSAVGYIQQFDIPFEFTPSDHLKNVVIKANITLSSCTKDLCDAHKLLPVLELAPVDPEDADFPFSIEDTSVKLAHNHAPRQHHENLSIDSLFIEKTEKGEQLLLSCTYDGGVDFFNIYIEGENAEEFYPPLIMMNDNTVEARFMPISTDILLENREFSIVASTKENINVRRRLGPQNNLIKESNTTKLIKTSIRAFFIGIILNFIPVGLLIWLLNINLLCVFGGTRAKNIKQITLYNMLGIISAGLITIISVCLYKALGGQILIGMQYKNISLLVFAVFALSVASLYFKKIILLSQSFSKHIAFASGFLVILIQIFIPVPYNTEILGFALLANNWEMILVLVSLLTGVCIPFALFYYMPEIASSLGSMHKFLNKINKFQQIILWSLLISMFVILCYHTSWHIMWYFLIILPTVAIILFLRGEVLISIQSQELENKEYKKAKLKLNVIVLCLILILISILFMGAFSLSKNPDTEEYRLISYDDEIALILKQKRNALLKLSSDWCFLCKYNEHMVFELDTIKNKIKKANIDVIDVDFDNNKEEALELLGKYGKYNLPLYVLYTPNMPDGLVLPANISQNMLENLFKYLH